MHVRTQLYNVISNNIKGTHNMIHSVNWFIGPFVGKMTQKL